MERKIFFFPAWDRTDPDPKKDYGVNDLELRFVVLGDGKAVEFQLHTGWYQPHIMDRRYQEIKQGIYLGNKDYLVRRYINPFPADVCCFSINDLGEDSTYFEGGLDYLFDHVPCYYSYKYDEENSGMYSPDHALGLLVEKGDETLWQYLENYYRECFGVDK